MEDLGNLQEKEDDLTVWERFKNLSNKKIALSDTGKATLATAISAPVLLEGMAHLGNVGLGISAAATILSFLHGDKAIQAGRWVKGKIIEDNGLRPQSDEGGTLSLKERFLEINGLHLQSEGRSFKETSLQGMTRGVSPMQHPPSEHPENETLRLGEDIKKKRRIDPWVNDLFGKGMIASAVQGSGKSMLCGLIIEQTAKCGVPVIIFDHKGEYAGIAELPFVNGLRAGSGTLRSKIGNYCFELSVENADDFVQLVMSERHQAIIHLPSYGDGWVDRAEIVAAVGQALMRYASKQREAGNKLIPCLVFMDEAQLYIPQNPSLLPPEAQKSKDVLDSLNNAYFALVSNGRSNGYTVCFATQSLTYIAKWAIKSCQIRVLMRHTEKNDLDMCEQIINPSIATREEIEAFPPGTGVVFGFTPKPVVVKFDKRQSQDFSETPGIDRLRAPRQQLLPDTGPIKASPTNKSERGKTLTLDAVLALAGKISDDALLAMIDKLPDKQNTGELATFDEEQEDERKPEPTLLERGMNAYSEGHTTIDGLAVALSISSWEARKLMPQIKLALKQEQEN